jgi:16S rRNA (cytidine1402-2'-O)-methyltransferase
MLRNAGITTPLDSFHTQNEHRKTESLIEKLKAGTTIALVTDAGTPAISDPGFLLVREAHRNKIPVSPVPGASAAIAALSASGLPSDRFIFEGFLPQKKGRKKRLEALREESRTIIFYESPHRIGKFTSELVEVFGKERLCVVARELTKKFEEILQCSLGELQELVESRNGLKGELVIIVAGKGYQSEEHDDDADES